MRRVSLGGMQFGERNKGFVKVGESVEQECQRMGGWSGCGLARGLEREHGIAHITAHSAALRWCCPAPWLWHTCTQCIVNMASLSCFAHL